MIFHQNDVTDWFLDKQECEVVSPAQIFESGNIRALIFGVMNKTNIDQTYNDFPLLNRVCDLGSRIFVDFCLDYGADVAKSTKEKETPLGCAARSDNLDICKLLVEKGAPKQCQYKSPLHFAAEGGSVDVIKYLLSR